MMRSRALALSLVCALARSRALSLSRSRALARSRARALAVTLSRARLRSHSLAVSRSLALSLSRSLVLAKVSSGASSSPPPGAAAAVPRGGDDDDANIEHQIMQSNPVTEARQRCDVPHTDRVSLTTKRSNCRPHDTPPRDRGVRQRDDAAQQQLVALRCVPSTVTLFVVNKGGDPDARRHLDDNSSRFAASGPHPPRDSDTS